MTKLQQKLARTYEEDGYSATLTFWAENQDEINALSEKERSSLKNMMSRYCRINGDEKNAGFILEERSDVSDKKIVMHLFWFGNRFLRKDKTYSSEKLYDIISKIVSEEIKDPEMNEIMGKLFALAKAYDTKTDFHQLEFLYDEIFKRADAEQLFILGEMYLNGDVIEQNFQKTVECFQKSALSGNKLSAYRLGEMYMLGLGLAKNKAKAEDFYSAANAEKEFYSNTLTRMAIPEGISSIKNAAFEGFENLRSVIIPESVKKIGDRAFKGCKNLESVKFSDDSIVLGFEAFEGCPLNEETKELINKTNYVFIKGNGDIDDFIIGKYPVTQDLFEEIMKENPSEFKGKSLPVENVSLDSVIRFCNLLSERDGLKPYYDFLSSYNYEAIKSANGYRLPSISEWMYAANGGSQDCLHKYVGSSKLSNVAWFRDNSEGRTHDVGKKVPNELGIFDMLGNVWELCVDNDMYHMACIGCSFRTSSQRFAHRGNWILWNPNEVDSRSIGFRIVRNAD